MEFIMQNWITTEQYSVVLFYLEIWKPIILIWQYSNIRMVEMKESEIAISILTILFYFAYYLILHINREIVIHFQQLSIFSEKSWFTFLPISELYSLLTFVFQLVILWPMMMELEKMCTLALASCSKAACTHCSEIQVFFLVCKWGKWYLERSYTWGKITQ